MAIKGKRRPRSRGSALPPRPTVPVRKTPLAMRRPVKRAVVIVLSVLSLLGGLRVWQNVSRSDAVREYNRKLLAAQAPLIDHLRPNVPTNVQQNLTSFTEGKMTGKQFLDLATLWETDFTKAKAAVAALATPNAVTADAQKLIVEGLDGYVGVARLYNVAAQMKIEGEAAKVAAEKKKWDDKVQVLLQHALEWRQRADNVYTVGQTLFDDLKDRYGVEKKLEPTTGSTTGQ